MVAMIGGAVLALTGVSAAVLDRLYSDMPVRELRRQARAGDPLARKLYRVAVYGPMARVLFWAVMVVSFAAGAAMVLPGLPFWEDFVLLAVSLVILFVIIPALRLNYLMAVAVALPVPLLTRILAFLHGPLRRLSGLAGRSGADPAIIGPLYEKQDLLDALHRQRSHAHNRISTRDLELTARALTFGDRPAAGVLRPRKELFLVDADDTIGPVLLNQMHASGQKTCLAYKDKKSNIIGSLRLSDAAKAERGGRVLDLVRGDLMYVHEDFSLRQVLEAFHSTGQQIAAVVNRFEEFLGIVTLDMLTNELLGESGPADAADYNNRSAVAAYDLSADKPEKPADGNASPESTEVVE